MNKMVAEKKKSTTKKRGQKKQVGAEALPPIRSEKQKTVSVRKVQNGFVVNIWDGSKDFTYVAKTQDELSALLKKHVGV